MTPRSYLLGFATLKAQSMRHGHRPGLAFAPWCTRGLPACQAAESDRGWRRQVKIFQKVNLVHSSIYVVNL